MSDNVILDDFDRLIGSYADVKRYLIDTVKKQIDNGEYETDVLEILADLESYKDTSELVVVDDNNGMGYTVKKYSETIQKL